MGFDDGSHYQILDVDETCSTKCVRTAFRNLARLLHPDKSQIEGTTQAFMRLQDAYEVLTDPTKRREYDLERAGFSVHHSPFYY